MATTNDNFESGKHIATTELIERATDDIALEFQYCYKPITEILRNLDSESRSTVLSNGELISSIGDKLQTSEGIYLTLPILELYIKASLILLDARKPS
jgi:hypothetical protein